MSNKEQLIKETRTIEAMKKGYMGLEGKFSFIAKNLGTPIVKQGDFSQNHFYNGDPFYDFEKEDFIILDESDNSEEIGIFFDGLSYGINMSITVGHYLNEIKCTYEGKVVYLEFSGDLEGYIPDETWEKKINDLMDIARKSENKRRVKERSKALEQVNIRKNKIIEHLKNKWGF